MPTPAEEIAKLLRPEGRSPGHSVRQVSRFLGGWRFLFMPVGLFALIAVGVHAAADTLDDRILWVVDAVDAWFDRMVGAWSVTAGAVHLIELDDRTFIARAVTLVWELCAIGVLAIPALGYREVEDGPSLHGWQVFIGTSKRRWRDIFTDVVRRPTVLRLTRPIATAAVVVAGACAIGRMVQGAIYLSQREWLGDGVAGFLARMFALAALAGVLLAFGMRAVLRNLQYADEIATAQAPRPWLEIFARGIVGSAIVVPLALAALLDATPLLSFFR